MQKVLIGTDSQTYQTVYLTEEDRPYGSLLVGQTGHGKTSLVERMIAQDIRENTSAVIFDPHGELSERILRIGAEINPQNILFCEIGANTSYGFNPLEVKTPGDPLEESQTIDSLMQVFRKHWSSNPVYSFGSRAEWVLSNTARTILANPGYTLAEIPLLLHDRAFRDKLVRNVFNPQVQFFWGEYRQLESTRRPIDTWQMVESTITRLSQFLANEWLYRVLYQAKGTIKFYELIESGKTIIFYLPIGKLGEEPAALLGSLLLGKLVTTIFGRSEYGKTPSRLHIYIDEYSRFCTPITSSLLTQGRKFNVGTTLTVQTLAQIPDEENKAAILQTGNLLAFQCIGSDADIIAKQMPLPDPSGLMRPEPVLLYSHTAVEDIWHRGHPNEAVMQIRYNYFHIVDWLEKHPREEYWQFNPEPILQKHPEWRKNHTKWDMFRSSPDMIKEGISTLDRYYYNWMQHTYSPIEPASQEEIEIILKILECIAGGFGWQPIMSPYMTEEKQDYLYHRLEHYFDSIGEKYYGYKSDKYYTHSLIDDRPPWELMELREPYEELLQNLRNHHLTKLGRVSPEEIIKVALEINIPPREAEKLVSWGIKPGYARMDLGTEMVKSVLGEITPGRQIIKIGHEQNKLKYTTDSFNMMKQDVWRINQANDFIRFGLRGCGYLLEKEPVYAPSSSYHDIELSRRTYSDLREELVTKLVSLPPYQAICALAQHGGELPIQIKTPPPLQINPAYEEEAKNVRERSRKQLGHPMQEVYKDIQTRQDLPPAKPHIPDN